MRFRPKVSEPQAHEMPVFFKSTAIPERVDSERYR